MVRDHLGSLEQLALLAIARLGDDAYGVSIKNEINERTVRDLSVGSLYATLERLENKGFVKARLGPPTTARGGRAKKFFLVTGTGMRTLEHSLSDIRSLRRGLILVDSCV